MKGIIIKSIAGSFYVLDTDNNKEYICKAKGIVRNQNIIPICGDIVDFSYDEVHNFASINEIMPRKNSLIRPLVANIDLALIVMSTIKPKFDSYLVDKLITCCRIENIEPVIIVSKCEFISDDIKSLLENYRKANYQVIELSSLENINVNKIKELIKGKKVVLAGQSAVGKSTLINALKNDNTRLIGEYSEKLGRGKHQTREVEYIRIDDAFVADSPGFSSLEIKIDLVDFAKVFKDFEKYSHNCRFNTCLHKNEPDCAVKKAVEDGLIDIRRYNNYLHLQNEIKDGKHVWIKK